MKNFEARFKGAQAAAKVPVPRPATPPPVAAVSPLPPASGFENEEVELPPPLFTASEDIRVNRSSNETLAQPQRGRGGGGGGNGPPR